MVVQCIGGIAGAGLLRGLVHDELRGASALGVTQLHQNISPAQVQHLLYSFAKIFNSFLSYF